jgi:hypothetical protein
MARQHRGDRAHPITPLEKGAFVTLHNARNTEFQAVVVIASPPSYVVEFPSRSIRTEHGLHVTNWLPILIDQFGTRDLYDNTWTIRVGTMDTSA